mgnify:CR=1 FL=1
MIEISVWELILVLGFYVLFGAIKWGLIVLVVKKALSSQKLKLENYNDLFKRGIEDEPDC